MIHIARPLSARAGWIRINEEAFYTTNLGKTWSRLNLPRARQNSAIHGLWLLPGLLQGWAVQSFGPGLGFGNQAIYHTADGGKTWVWQWQEKTVEGPKFPQILDGFSFLDSRHGLVLDGRSVLATDDGGRSWTWSRIHGDERYLHNDNHDIAQVALKQGFYWLLFRDGSLFQSTDGGRNWFPLTQSGPIWARDDGIVRVDLFAGDSGCGVALGGDGILYQTRDGGHLWTKPLADREFFSMSCSGQFCWLSDDDRNLFRFTLCSAN